MFRAILFDLDGTITDTIDLIVHCFDLTLDRLTGRRWNREEVVALFGPTEPAIIERFAPPEQRVAECEAFFSCYDALHDRMAHTFAGIDRVIRDAHARGVRLGLVTNKGRRTTEITVRKCGLNGWLEAVVTGEDASAPKPDPGGIRLGLARLGVAPEDALFVGDAPSDILAGQRAGVSTCAVTWGRVHDTGELLAARPDHVCRTPDELGQLVSAPRR